MTHYTKEIFEKEFLSIDFDQMASLLAPANYQPFKNNYLDATYNNLQTLTTLLDELNTLQELVQHAPNKFTFTFVDQQQKQHIECQVNSLVSAQQLLLTNFTNHIQCLQTRATTTTTTTKQKKFKFF